MWANLSKYVLIPLATKLGGWLVNYVSEWWAKRSSDQAKAEYATNQEKRYALTKAIASAKTDKELIALSAMLSDLNSK